MDISALSIGMNQSNVKAVGVEVTKMAITVKENIEINPNIGQNLYVIAVAQKDRSEELNRKQQQNLSGHRKNRK